MLQEFKLLKKFCNTLWEYNPKNNQLYIHHDIMFPDLENAWHEYTPIYQEHTDTYIDHEDLQIWKHYMSPEQLQKFYVDGPEEAHFYIHTHAPAVGEQWHEAYITRSDAHLLICSKDIQKEQRNASIAKALLPEFDYVCRIDVSTKSYVLYYAAAERTIVPIHANDDYEKIMWDFNHKRVVPQEADSLCQHMMISHVIAQLENNSEYILYATVIEEDDHLSYKKLRFCYADQEKRVLLLTRTDVTGLMKERKQREDEQRKRLNYLENMPIGFCSLEVLLDEKKKPIDFCFTYCNRAHEEIEGVSHGELIGKRFYQFFKETDPKWLRYYYETAYLGIPHILKSYSPEIKKYLLNYTFRTEVGHCNCIIIDITKEYLLENELHQSRTEMKRILKNTTSFVFQYQPSERRIYINSLDTPSENTSYQEDLWFNKMARLGYLAMPYLKPTIDIFKQIRAGIDEATLIIRARMKLDVSWSWYRLVLFNYKGTAENRKVLGYLQNIDHDMEMQQKLREKAETDPLTGILNVGGGKKQAVSLLQKQTPGIYYAMFIMDVDNFKNINDTYGHLTGDEVLKRFSSALYDSFRSADIVYRLGGDEFAAFISFGSQPTETIDAILQRFYQNLSPVQKAYPFLTSSIGIYASNKTHPNALYAYETYYAEADKELYHAKKSGKNRHSLKIENQ